jgi:hypothetical protein
MTALLFGSGDGSDALREILNLFLEATLAALLLSLFVTGLAWLGIRGSFFKVLARVMPFGWLGTVIGLIAGASQEALVGALLSGILTLIGALLSYAYTKNSDDALAQALPFGVALLCISALVGLTMGHISRGKQDEYRTKYAEWQKRVETVDLPAMAIGKRYLVCVKLMPKKDAAKCEQLLLK